MKLKVNNKKIIVNPIYSSVSRKAEKTVIIKIECTTNKKLTDYEIEKVAEYAKSLIKEDSCK